MKSVKTFYWLPKCTTCQRAEQFLLDHGITIDTYVDVKTEAVDKATLQQLAEALGGVDKLFSKRALKYRALGLHEQTLSDADMLDWMAKEYTFIKRPVLVTDEGQVLSGFVPKQYKTLVAQATPSA